MKRFSLILAAMMLLGSGTMSAWQGDVAVQTPNTQLVLHAYEGGDLRMGYYGNKSATMQQLRDGGADLNFSALPAFGTVDAVWWCFVIAEAVSLVICLALYRKCDRKMISKLPD